MTLINYVAEIIMNEAATDMLSNDEAERIAAKIIGLVAREQVYSLAVPSEIAEALPDGITFVPRVTDEGLLYAPVTQMGSTLPDWAKATPTEKKK